MPRSFASSAQFTALYHICLLLASLVSPSVATTPRVAIVNEKAFHLEVLAGFVHILREYEDSTTVYMHQLNFHGRAWDFGFLDFLGRTRCKVRVLPSVEIPEFDIVVFVSPEYRVEYVREFIERTQPKLVFFMVHNGDAERLPELATLHSNAHLLTLAPHVAKYVSNRLTGSNTTVNWMLPTKPLVPAQPCDQNSLRNCLSGFAIQGGFDAKRRNYTQLWQQMDAKIRSSQEHQDEQKLLVHAVGSGNPTRLEVPATLEQRVVPHINLDFLSFYELIHHNFALLPVLAQDAYYDKKFSSTLITSLTTGVPLIVEQRFLTVYTFLTDAHVFVPKQDEQTVDIMIRVLQRPSAELAAQRQLLAALQESLNHKALLLIQKLWASLAQT